VIEVRGVGSATYGRGTLW